MGIETIAAIGLSAAGTGLGIFGGINGANAQADAEERDAELKRRQAEEAIARAGINADVIRDQALEIKEGIQGSYAKAGVSGGGLLHSLNETDRIMRNEIIKIYKEAQFRESQIMAGAQAQLLAVQSMRKAAPLNAVAGGIGGAGSILGGLAGTGLFTPKQKSGGNITGDTPKQQPEYVNPRSK